MKKYYVYRHIFPNGKMYIGITSKEPNKRWENGFGYSKEKQSVMYNAIQKYGWENVKHEILFENLTYEEANSKEMELISKYKTNCRRYGNDYGYNMTDGGDGTKGHKLSSEAKEKISASHLGKIGKDCPNSKPVICDGIEYESLTQFRETHDVSTNISAWLNGTRTMPKIWYDRGLHYKDLGFDVIRCREKQEYKQIIFDNMTFNTQKELAEYLDICPATVCDWFTGKHRVPKNILDKGLCFKGENTILKEQDSPTKTRVFYDGKVFDSQRELASFLNVKPATLHAWLKDKNPMPQKYKDKGLKLL